VLADASFLATSMCARARAVRVRVRACACEVAAASLGRDESLEMLRYLLASAQHVLPSFPAKHLPLMCFRGFLPVQGGETKKDDATNC
jgi:hypothetical protein